jgi:hypothetical protein
MNTNSNFKGGTNNGGRSVASMLLPGIMFANQGTIKAGKKESSFYEKGVVNVTLGNARAGTVNWETRYITAKGIVDNPSQGMAMSRRGAIVDAQRNLLEIIKGVRINSETVVSDRMVSEIIRTEVKGTLKNSEIVNEEWDGNIYEVTMRVPLGKIVKIFKKPDNVGLSANTGTFKREIVEPRIYTGLVIDARGLDLTPAIFVNIYNESGERVCGQIHPVYRVSTRGIEDIDEERIGRNPLRITASGTIGSHDVDIIIDDEDVQNVIENILNTGIFSKSKVIVLID